MNTKAFGYMACAVVLLSTSQLGNAQNLPTPELFDQALKVCAAAQHVELNPQALDSISRLYSSDSSRQVLRSPQEFLLLIPENNRIEAYRLYADCITKIVPQVASTTQAPANLSQTQPTPIYRICTGEYERACQTHDVYLYCNASIEAWAQDRCANYTSRRLNAYGGNKCGYSLDEVICNGPK
jgi:hypothetical protein